MADFPIFRQLDSRDCGATCLRMIVKHYGKNISLERLRTLSQTSRVGTSFLGIAMAAEQIGFNTLSVLINDKQLESEVPMPAILHWDNNHFVVIHKIRRNKYYIADPQKGLIIYSKKEFLDKWSFLNSLENNGHVLLLEKNSQFDTVEEDINTNEELSIALFFKNYVNPFKNYIFQLFLGTIFGSIAQLIFPFLIQAIVDIGIDNHNINFIKLVLLAQLILFISKNISDYLRAWILLHINTKINIKLVSDFLTKLLKLPMSFFENRMVGDIIQRIYDHKRIEYFLTSVSLDAIFSFVNILLFGAILLLYNVSLFLIFFIGTTIYLLWILLFLKKRGKIDTLLFEKESKSQNNIIQIIVGIIDIKLHNIEILKRWEWEKIQAKLFKINMNKLAITQYQEAGSAFINESKNIIILFVAAKSVLDGQITLGTMMSITYIVGQLNSPINQLISFVQGAQDAKLSMQRIGSIRNQREETKGSANLKIDYSTGLNNINHSISINNLSFSYPNTGDSTKTTLNNINAVIPEGKVTAIVGTSGSGKSTLVKLLLKFYDSDGESIKVGDQNLNQINNAEWRNICGVVMQEGFIFSDTIAKNISMEDFVDEVKLKKAIEIANLNDFIKSLPLGYITMIGQEGIGISSGQKQRILIARAVYKEPRFLFLDEATNALDAENETIILNNLNSFFNGRTVVIIAHRLSTVKNADRILVLEKGSIVEIGNHNELVEKSGKYFNLVRNQLELGS